MRNKIIPESLAERLALWAGKVPLPVVETIFPLLMARSLMAAERLGIFEALRDAPLPPAVLASELGLDEESLRLMLGVLVGSGYLAERDGQYRLSRLARKTLLRGGSLECLGFLRFNYAQWEFVEHLEQLLQTGQGLDLHRTMQRSQDWETTNGRCWRSPDAMLPSWRAKCPCVGARGPWSTWADRTGCSALPSAAGTPLCAPECWSCRSPCSR